MGDCCLRGLDASNHITCVSTHDPARAAWSGLMLQYLTLVCGDVELGDCIG